MALLIGDIVRRAARMAPGAVAASLGAERVTFGALDEAADRTANALAGLGVRGGDRVVWWSAPALRTLDSFLGCARLGAVFAPVNPALSDVEFAAVLDYLDPRLVVTDAERAGPSHAIAATLTGAPGSPKAAVAETDPHILKERLPGTTTTILYGSTEAGRMAALPDWDLARKPGSVGLPAFPGTLWVDGDGEVIVGGDTLMSGYHALPDETAAALPDGAYRSGDVGRLDSEGYLYLTGRTREVIRSGGESVSPSEVEYALRDLPGVRDVAVVGLPDARWGEVVCAAVVPAGDGAVPDVAAVRAHVAGRLAPFKQPRRVAVVEAIPRTPATGQIQRSRVREVIIETDR